jgi:hypothetical protein
MDDLDRLLKSMPSDHLPFGLVHRTRANFRQRRLRQQRITITLSLTLIALGSWLSAPGLLNLGSQIQVGGNAVNILNAILSGLFDAGTALATYSSGSNSLQASLNSSLGLTAWIGIMALAAGALVGISGMLRRSLR